MEAVKSLGFEIVESGETNLIPSPLQDLRFFADVFFTVIAGDPLVQTETLLSFPSTYPHVAIITADATLDLERIGRLFTVSDPPFWASQLSYALHQVTKPGENGVLLSCKSGSVASAKNFGPAFWIVSLGDIKFHKRVSEIFLNRRDVIAVDPQSSFAFSVSRQTRREQRLMWEPAPLPPCPPDNLALAGALQRFDEVLSGHSNVVAVFAGPRVRGGKPTGDPAIVVVVPQKGLIPFEESAFPLKFEDFWIDVWEGSVSLLTVSQFWLSVWPEAVKIKNHSVRGGQSIGGLASSSGEHCGTMGLCLFRGEERVGITSAHVFGWDKDAALQSPSKIDAAYLDTLQLCRGQIGGDQERHAVDVMRGVADDVVLRVPAHNGWPAMCCDVGIIKSSSLQLEEGLLQAPASAPKVSKFTSVMPATDFSSDEGAVYYKCGRSSGYTKGQVFAKWLSCGKINKISRPKDDNAARAAITSDATGKVEVIFEDLQEIYVTGHVLMSLSDELSLGFPTPAFAQPGDAGAVVFKVGDDGEGCLCGQVVARIYTPYGPLTVVLPLEPVLAACNLTVQPT